MIGYLKGRVVARMEGKLIVECSGVGYLVAVGKSDWVGAEEGQEWEGYIHTHVKEDQLALYGFREREALMMFEKLLGVSKVGPKTAIAVMGAGGVVGIRKAIEEGEVEFFTRVPGVGKKSAQRLIVELKSKLDLKKVWENENEEEVEALVRLGIRRKEAREALHGVEKSLSSEEKLKQALKNLNRR